jgi:hypothetical protein
MWSCADSRAVTDALAMTGSCVGRASGVDMEGRGK